MSQATHRSSFRGLRSVAHFYVDGFRRMTVGRTLWIVIAVKVAVIFGLLRFFFFPDLLNTRFDNDADRAGYVLDEITRPQRRSPHSHSRSTP